MNVEEIASLLGYNCWANQRLLTLAERVPPERHHERFGGGADTLHRTFVHLLSAEVTWLQRCQGRSPLGGIDPSELPDLAAVRARWDAHDQAVAEFLAGLSPERLAIPVCYVNFSGETWEYPLWQMLLHLINHGTHHRSEIADLLTRLGQPPPPMDLLVYYDELAAA